MPSSACNAQRSTTFSLSVALGYGADSKTGEDLNKACSKQNFGLSEMASSFFSGSSPSSTLSSSCTSSSDVCGNNINQNRFFVASASQVRLRMNPSEKFWKTTAYLIIVFVPPHMITSALENHFSSNHIASGSSFWIDPPSSFNFSKDLLPKIHPTAFVGCRISGIVLTSIAADNGPAELLIIEVPKGKSIQSDILRVTNGCTIDGDPDSGVLKILPITTIEFSHVDDGDNRRNNQVATGSNVSLTSTTVKPPEIPTCPVCIHRIDPIRLGLPVPGVQQLCSKFCPSPSLVVGSWRAEEETCKKQRLLNKWALPARCKACQVIDHYWNYSNIKQGHGQDDENRDLFCEECSMHKTLWTCLTCGFVGCGRYSNKHSVAHFEQTRHPYSLELATLRIWDYCQGEYGGFVQRADLLECPSSRPLLYPWLTRGLNFDDQCDMACDWSTGNRPNDSLYGSGSANLLLSKKTEKSFEKVMMIGEEYEVLLQSALEDQAQHYEDEIARLRAKHTDSMVDRGSIVPEEAKEIENLRIEIRIARENIEKTSAELIASQAREVELRAASGRLLSEQKESNELLEKIREEHRRENELGNIEIEDLEQQIADLSANLRMRQEFSKNDELTNAQIVGTTSNSESKNVGYRKGKKKGRYFRK